VRGGGAAVVDGGGGAVVDCGGEAPGLFCKCNLVEVGKERT